MIVRFPVPTSPALFVTVQLYVPKSVTTERFNSNMSEVSRILSPVFSFLHIISLTSGFVLVTLQMSVVEPPRMTCEDEATTSTSGGLSKHRIKLEFYAHNYNTRFDSYTVVSRVSAHGCLNITRDLVCMGANLGDQNPICLYRSCYSGPLKFGKWALTREGGGGTLSLQFIMYSCFHV